MNVTPKEKRGYKHPSSYFLKSILEVTEDISNSLLEVNDFAKAYETLKVKDEDYHLVFPMITKVLDALAAAKNGKE